MLSNRPGIFQIGKVVDNGREVIVSGWGLCLCASRCRCHQMTGGKLAMLEDPLGRLGLWSSRGEDCECCTPWAHAELMGILADLAAIQALVPYGGSPLGHIGA